MELRDGSNATSLYMGALPLGAKLEGLPTAGLPAGLLPAYCTVLVAAALLSLGVSAVLSRRRRARCERLLAAAAGRDKERKISWAEFRAHGAGQDAETADSVWIAIHGKVYDIAAFIPTHPGGSGLIASMAGRDASDVFAAMHMPRVQRRLPPLLVGTLTEAPKARPVSSEYRELRTRLWKEGWFECDMMYVARKDLLVACIFAFGIWAATQGESPFLRVLVGGCAIGLALQQVAFVAHDAGHRGITHCSAGGDFNLLGWLHGTVAFGVSAEMWLDEHNRHHALTMRPSTGTFGSGDPQFDYLPMWLVSRKELATFYNRPAVERTIARVLVPFQHLTILPLSLVVGRFNLHIVALFWVLKKCIDRPFILVAELLGLLLYTIWFGNVVLLLPATPEGCSFLFGERFLFLMVAYITAGVLHVQLTVSHLATDAFTAEEEEAEQFFCHQLKTTRNIDSNWWNDWLHGGLQYQIEHHLFPQMPRHNLAKVKPHVEKLCAKHNIPYQSAGFFAALRHCLADFERLSHFLGDLIRPDEICGGS